MAAKATGIVKMKPKAVAKIVVKQSSKKAKQQA